MRSRGSGSAGRGRRKARPARVLVLLYTLPANPSRYRVAVWRRLRRLGAVLVHRSAFLLPDTPLNRLRAAEIAHDVENWGGRARVFAGREEGCGR